MADNNQPYPGTKNGAYAGLSEDCKKMVDQVAEKHMKANDTAYRDHLASRPDDHILALYEFHNNAETRDKSNMCGRSK